LDFWFFIAEYLEAVIIAVISEDSFSKSLISSKFIIPASTNNSSQNCVSSASSTTIPSLEIKSFEDLALHTADNWQLPMFLILALVCQ